MTVFKPVFLKVKQYIDNGRNDKVYASSKIGSPEMAW